MTLVEWIRKRERPMSTTATSATGNPVKPPSVAQLATVAEGNVATLAVRQSFLRSTEVAGDQERLDGAQTSQGVGVYDLGTGKVIGQEGKGLNSCADEVAIESASSTARPIYWEAMDGTWHGPVKPEYLGRTETASREQFWVIVSYKGTIRWILVDLLRSQEQWKRRRL